MKSLRLQRESGAVSLFMVIFAMLLITIITVSFLRLMVADQRQASDTDLSQSAYDSAQAGIEDAKRALIRYQQICTNSSPDDCNARRTVIASDQCNTSVSADGIAVVDSTTREVMVQQTQSVDAALDQAYTCLKIQLETDNYEGNLGDGESQIVPLVGAVPFNTVTIRWFEQRDVDESTNGGAISLGSPGTQPLVTKANWSRNTPPVMRAQLIQFGSGFTMNQFDYVEPSGQSNANTTFLYPTRGGSTIDDLVTLDSRTRTVGGDPTAATTPFAPRAVSCQTDLATNGPYSCQMSLRIPEPIGGGQRTAFLRLTPFYNATRFDVVLSNGNPTVDMVQFRDVQPIIDSTGRANDMFRRLESRVNLYNTDFPYPDATIDITGNFCKSFAVSDIASTYANSIGTCTP